MKIRLSNGDVILFDKKEEPILLQLAQNDYSIYKNYDECRNFFLKQFDNCKIKYDFEKYENKLFFFNEENRIVGDYNLKRHIFWMDYDKIWSIFESQFNLNYIDIKVLTRYLVETHFKLRCETTPIFFTPIRTEVETHFKLRCVNTDFPLVRQYLKVETDFKLKCETTLHRELIPHSLVEANFNNSLY